MTKQIHMIWIMRMCFLHGAEHREGDRPRLSELDLNTCTTVSDWVSGLLAETACAGRERRMTAATQGRDEVERPSNELV